MLQPGADGEIGADGVPAGVGEVDRALLVALADDAYGILLKIGQVDADQLGKAHAVVYNKSG